MSVPIPGYPNPPPPGLNETIEAAGLYIGNEGGVWVTNTEASVALILAIVATYNPLPYVRALRIQEAAAMKEEVEGGGFTTTGNIPLDTQESNQLRLLRLACSTEAIPTPASFVVKDRNNAFHSLTRTDARTFGSEVNAFFQACLAGEGSAVAAINDVNKTWQQIMALDLRAFFPANS